MITMISQKVRCAYIYGNKDIEMFLAGRLAYLVFRLFLSRTRHCCDISLNLSVTLLLSMTLVVEHSDEEATE